MSAVVMPGFLKRLFESFRNAIIYSIAYIVVIWLVAYYLGYLGSREPLAVIFNGIFIVLYALCFGFGTEYARLSLKYRNTDFSKARRFVHNFIYAILAAVVLYGIEYLLRFAKILP